MFFQSFILVPLESLEGYLGLIIWVWLTLLTDLLARQDKSFWLFQNSGLNIFSTLHAFTFNCARPKWKVWLVLFKYRSGTPNILLLELSLVGGAGRAVVIVQCTLFSSLLSPCLPKHQIISTNNLCTTICWCWVPFAFYLTNFTLRVARVRKVTLGSNKAK